jgi:hypothetical protein
VWLIRGLPSEKFFGGDSARMFPQGLHAQAASGARAQGLASLPALAGRTAALPGALPAQRGAHRGRAHVVQGATFPWCLLAHEVCASMECICEVSSMEVMCMVYAVHLCPFPHD